MPNIGDIREETQTDPVLGTRRVRSVYVAPGVGWKIEEALSEWVQPEKKPAWQEKYEKVKPAPVEEPQGVPLTSRPYYTTPELPVTEVPIVKEVTQVVTITPKKEEPDLLESLFGFLRETEKKAERYGRPSAVPFAPVAGELSEQIGSEVSTYLPSGLVTGKREAAPIPFAPMATEVVSRTKEALGREDVYVVGGPIETYIKKGISEQMKEEGEFRPPAPAVPIEMESFAPRFASAALVTGKAAALGALEAIPSTAYGAGLLFGRAAKGEAIPGLVGEAATGVATFMLTPILTAPAAGKFLGQKELTPTEIQEAQLGFESFGKTLGTAFTFKVAGKAVGKVARKAAETKSVVSEGFKEELWGALERRYGLKASYYRGTSLGFKLKAFEETVTSPGFITKAKIAIENPLSELGKLGPRKAQFTFPGLTVTETLEGVSESAFKSLTPPSAGFEPVYPRVSYPTVSGITTTPATGLDLSWLAGLSQTQKKQDMYDITTETISVKQYGTPKVVPAEAITQVPSLVSVTKPITIEIEEIKPATTPKEKGDVYIIPLVPEFKQPKEREELIVIPTITPGKQPKEETLPIFFKEEPYKPQRMFKPIKISKQPTRYVPSFAAMALGITAKRKPRFISGFELRPIVVGKAKPTKFIKQKKEKPLGFGMQLPTLLMKKGTAKSNRSGLGIPSTLGSNLFGIKKGGVRLRSLV